MKTKKQAERGAKNVQSQIGKEWKYTIWENLGWHVHWLNGAISLNYTSRNKSFWCMIGEPNSGCGHLDFGRATHHFLDPKKAIKSACLTAKMVIKKQWQPIIDSINQISDSMG